MQQIPGLTLTTPLRSSRSLFRTVFVALLPVAMLAILLTTAAAPASATPPLAFINQTLVSELDEPTAIDFLPDGRMLIVERTGDILLSVPPYTTVEPTPVVTITNLELLALNGGLGIYNMLVDPGFDANHYFYLFYSPRTPPRERIARFTFDPETNTAPLASEVVVWQDNKNRRFAHFGGGLSFAPDGNLYFTTGDHYTASDVAQDLTASWGKLLRITVVHDGSGPAAHPYYTIPVDNPFNDGAGPNYDEIYAYGLRNPFRISFDSEGNLYIGDVGGNVPESAIEEINMGVRGANYGWPNCEGATCSDDTENTAPVFGYTHQDPDNPGAYRDASVIGGLVYEGLAFSPPYQGVYFYGDYAQETIRYLTLDDYGNVTGDFDFEPVDGALDDPTVGDVVDLKIGPDDALYYVDIGIPWGGSSDPFAGSIRQVWYNDTGNEPPLVVATADVASGLSPLTVNFTGQATDPEGDPLTFNWDFDDGAASTLQSPSHTYTSNGRYAVRLTVSDGTHAIYSDPIYISVGTPPVISITAPVEGALFRAGDTIMYSGEGDDPDGQLTPSSFSWRVVLHHESHVHPVLGPICCTTASSFEVSTTGHDWFGNTWYELVLTVTDSDGLQSVDSVNIYPDKVDVTFDTAPSGLVLRLDGILTQTPFVRDTLIGFEHIVEAALTQELGPDTYQFVAWSDGGAPEHVIVVPAVPTTLTAEYQSVPATPTPTATPTATPTPTSTPTATPTSTPPLCPIEMALNQPTDKNSLHVLRQFRDEVLAAHSATRHYVERYYRHAPELTRILLLDSELRTRAAQVLQRFLPVLRAPLEVEMGRNVMLTDRDLAAADALLAEISARSSSELKATLAELRGLLKQFEGRTVKDAWNIILAK